MTDTALGRIARDRLPREQTPVSRVALVTAPLAVVSAAFAIGFSNPVIPDWGNPALDELAPHLAAVDAVQFSLVAALAVLALVLTVARRSHPAFVALGVLLALAVPVMISVYTYEEVFRAIQCTRSTCPSLSGAVTASWVFYLPCLGLSAVLSTVALMFVRMAAAKHEVWGYDAHRDSRGARR